MNALKTTVVGAASSTINDIEDALAEARTEGAPDEAMVHTILGGIGPVFKVEWTDEEPNYATGGIVPGRDGAPISAIVHGGESVEPAH